MISCHGNCDAKAIATHEGNTKVHLTSNQGHFITLTWMACVCFIKLTGNNNNQQVQLIIKAGAIR